MSMHKMSVIYEIQSLAGLKAKMARLAQHPELKGILKACYNPYTQFYVKPTKAWITSEGHGLFCNHLTGMLLKNLTTRIISGKQAKQEVMGELNRLEPFSQELLLRILNKDMRFGMGPTSINKVFPDLIPVFPVQLAQLFKEEKAQWPMLISPKLDGLRCIYEMGTMYSRRGHVLQGLDHIIKPLEEAGVHRADGELTVPGMLFDDISGVVRSFKKTDNVVYNIWSAEAAIDTVPWAEPKGQKLTCQTRLENVLRLAKYLEYPEQISVVVHGPVFDLESALERYNQFRASGYEGAVLKNPQGLEFNGRNYDWMKLKARDTIDLEVTGYAYGQGKYEHCIGALICDFNGTEVRVGGGLSDKQRIAWAEDPSLIMGKVVEVEYMEESKNQALRHPRLKFVRGDK